MWQAPVQLEPAMHVQDLGYEATGVWGLEGEHLLFR